MRDISNKINTLRIAQAKAVLRVSPKTIELIQANKLPKGDPIAVARVAAIQAAKNTSQIIPYCHPLLIDHVGVEVVFEQNTIEITTHVKAVSKTGVEMEALTAASVAALTIYDMTKMVDDIMLIESVHLLSKTGGKSDWHHPESPILTAAVLVMSDSVAAGKKEDLSGKAIVERLQTEGFKISEYNIVRDDESEIVLNVRHYIDDLKVNLIVTTGGTGISKRDNTPEALSHLIELELPGISEAIRRYGQERNRNSMLSRAKAGICKNSLIISLPGSLSAVNEGLSVIFPAVWHAFEMLTGNDHTADTRDNTPVKHQRN